MSAMDSDQMAAPFTCTRRRSHRLSVREQDCRKQIDRYDRYGGKIKGVTIPLDRSGYKTYKFLAYNKGNGQIFLTTCDINNPYSRVITKKELSGLKQWIKYVKQDVAERSARGDPIGAYVSDKLTDGIQMEATWYRSPDVINIVSCGGPPNKTKSLFTNIPMDFILAL